MKPWKQALLNTIGYVIAFVVVQFFSKNGIGWSWTEALILTVISYALNFLLLSAINYANKK